MDSPILSRKVGIQGEKGKPTSSRLHSKPCSPEKTRMMWHDDMVGGVLRKGHEIMMWQ